MIKKSFFTCLLIWICLKEVIISNLKMLKICMSPHQAKISGLIRVQTKQCLNDHQIVLLSHLITITPGTITADILKDKTIVIHMLDRSRKEIEGLNTLSEKIETCLVEIFSKKVLT